LTLLLLTPLEVTMTLLAPVAVPRGNVKLTVIAIVESEVIDTDCASVIETVSLPEKPVPFIVTVRGVLICPAEEESEFMTGATVGVPGAPKAQPRDDIWPIALPVPTPLPQNVAVDEVDDPYTDAIPGVLDTQL
jgi:hypothetical protein